MAAPLAGQVTVGPTAAPLTTTQAVAFVIKASQTNAASCYIGPAGVTTANGYELAPGDTFEYERNSQQGQNRYQVDLGSVYVVGIASDRITWFASPI
jgi:hypothetical protein